MTRLYCSLLSLLLCLLAAAAVCSSSEQGSSAAAEARQAEMRRVRERMQHSRQKIESMQRQERNLLDQLDQMELRLEKLREQVAKLKAEQLTVQQEVALKRKRLQVLVREMQQFEALLGQRLRVLYKAGRSGYLDLLTSAADMSDLQHRWVYMRTIAEQDRLLLETYRRRQTEEAQLTRKLLAQEERLSLLVRDLANQKEEMENIRRQHVALLQDVHNREQMYRRYLAELETVSRNLEKVFANLQEQNNRRSLPAPHQGGFARQKGTLPYPVQGRIITRFGRKRYDKFGTTIVHKGIDMATKKASPVMAVYGGQIIYRGWIKGYGNVIIIDHGDKYYTLTAHLGDMAKDVGEKVEAGEVIGYAGYSATARSAGRIYFEIRHRGRALDPQRWLLPALAGMNSPGRG
ncbi:MAG: peptidoglycan DD-metalloendopeptidase family protein [Deltaproteobacteria bacterium]|nr:peptidoglycan DD-metalloendopeptidase family protein [Deltaproteobacteria bacterium]MBW2070216.1 peptidoglycan DD-metalloendopeptidase family protein [Deltaproteobacteria bacterium]